MYHLYVKGMLDGRLFEVILQLGVDYDTSLVKAAEELFDMTIHGISILESRVYEFKKRMAPKCYQ